MAEKEYIEREKLKQAFASDTQSIRGWDVDLFDLLMDEIDEVPAADVAPVKRGFWKPISESEMTGFNPKFAGRDPIAGYKCSNCGSEAIFSCNDEFVLSDYCPNCGARMDEQ